MKKLIVVWFLLSTTLMAMEQDRGDNVQSLVGADWSSIKDFELKKHILSYMISSGCCNLANVRLIDKECHALSSDYCVIDAFVQSLVQNDIKKAIKIFKYVLKTHVSDQTNYVEAFMSNNDFKEGLSNEYTDDQQKDTSKGQKNLADRNVLPPEIYVKSLVEWDIKGALKAFKDILKNQVNDKANIIKAFMDNDEFRQGILKELAKNGLFNWNVLPAELKEKILAYVVRADYHNLANVRLIETACNELADEKSVSDSFAESLKSDICLYSESLKAYTKKDKKEIRKQKRKIAKEAFRSFAYATENDKVNLQQVLWDKHFIRKLTGKKRDVKKFVNSLTHIDRQAAIRVFSKKVRIGEVEWVTAFLDAGIAVDEVLNTFERTPLMESAYYGQYDIAKLLITKGADINAATTKGMTPLMCAALSGQHKIVDLLLDNKANIHACNVRYTDSNHVPLEDQGYTALSFACRGDNKEKNYKKTVKKLLAHGARIDGRTTLNYTPLMIAVRYNNYEIVKLLLAKKAPVNAAVGLSKRSGSKPSTERLLLDFRDSLFPARDTFFGAYEINNHKYYTALMFAAESNNAKLVELLLHYGAHVSTTNGDGYTALQCAWKKNGRNTSPDIIDLLLKASVV